MAKKVKEKKQRHTLRTIVIVIVVILILGIIGGGMSGNNDNDEEGTTEAGTEAVTEKATEEITDTIMEPALGQEIETDETEKLNSPLDHITGYNYRGTEEDPYGSGKTYMFWSVNFDEDADTDWYDNDQFKEIIISCMQQPESKENEADDFSIEGFDSEGRLIFDWTSYDDKYTVTQYVWRSGKTNPDTYDWKFSGSDYSDILSARTEDESEIGSDIEVFEEESDSSFEWDAGDLAYLNMNRDELLAVYNAYDDFISEETVDMSADEAEAYEDESANQVASEYGITADDVKQIFSYGSEPGYFVTFDMNDVSVPYGDVQSVTSNGSEVSIKVKVSSQISNQQTIDQNYYNVCDFIRDYVKTDYDKISYWAVADTTDGDETKIISFDLSGDIINTIATQDFPDNTLGDYVENLYILPSLQE